MGNRTQNKIERLKTLKPFILAFSILFALLMTMGSTLSWFTSSDTVENQLRREEPGRIFDITLVDIFTKPNDPGPGDVYSKRVGAVNNGELSGFVRLLVLPTFVASDGVTVLPAEFGKQVILRNLNIDDWADGGDGYFYYLHVLEPSRSTDIDDLDQNLFSHVQLADEADLGEEYMGATLRIEVKCEAVGIDKWDYRIGWWGSSDPPVSAQLSAIDDTLKALAK